jgi:hypothetical protein
MQYVSDKKKSRGFRVFQMSWFRKKGTKLEEYCAQTDQEWVMNSYESHKDEKGLYLAIAWTILYSANDLKETLLKKNDIKKTNFLDYYAKTINPDVIIFEAAHLIWHMVSCSLFVLGRDMDGEENEVIFKHAMPDSLEFIFACMDEYTSFPDVRKLEPRKYDKDERKSMAKFVRLVIASEGRNEPLQKYEYKLGDAKTEIGVTAYSHIFATTMLPGTIETITRIVKYHFGKYKI